MSKVPGPAMVVPSSVYGMDASRPTGQTVS
jgi:hypothetical protein